jgi:hypothetical protein
MAHHSVALRVTVSVQCIFQHCHKRVSIHYTYQDICRYTVIGSHFKYTRFEKIKGGLRNHLAVCVSVYHPYQ